MHPWLQEGYSPNHESPSYKMHDHPQTCARVRTHTHILHVAWRCTYDSCLERIPTLQGQVHPWLQEGYFPNHESPSYKMHDHPQTCACARTHAHTHTHTHTHISCILRVSRKSPTPIQLIGVDRSVSPLQPIDEADASDRSAKGIPMPVRCGHRSWKSETNTCWTESIPACISFSTSRLL